MTRDVVFLREKFILFQRAAGKSERNINSSYQIQMLEKYIQANIVSRPRLKKLEKSVQEVWYASLSGTVIESVHRQLRAKYGYTSLSDTPDVVLKRVLRRGSLKTPEEAAVVRNLVSNVGKEKEWGEQTYNQLCEMVDRFESR